MAKALLADGAATTTVAAAAAPWAASEPVKFLENDELRSSKCQLKGGT